MFYFIGILYYLISIIVSMLVLYITFKFFIMISKIKTRNDLENGNIAFAILLGCYLIAFGVLMVKSLYPVSVTLQELFTNEIKMSRVMLSIGYVFIYFAASYILSLIAITISTTLFQLFTVKLDEMNQIRKNNIAVAVVLGSVVIASSIIIQPGLSFIINTLIPKSFC